MVGQDATSSGVQCAEALRAQAQCADALLADLPRASRRAGLTAAHEVPAGTLRIVLLNERCHANPMAGGAEIHLFEIFSRLAARGVSVELLCSGFAGAAARDVHRGVAITRLGARFWFYAKVAREVRRRVVAGEVDLIIEAHNKVPFLTPLYARSVPVLVIHHHLHGLTAFRQVSPWIAAASVALERTIPWVYRRVPFLTISKSSKSDLSNNRLTSRAMTISSPVVGATSHAFGYDGMDRMTAADSNEGISFSASISRTYNSLGKIQTEKQVLDGYNSGAGRTITYAWDEEGNKTSTTYPVGGTVIAYTRDALDRVDKISRGGAEIIDYTWSGNRVIKNAYPGSHTTMLYDGYARLTDTHHKDTSSGHSLARFTYGYDASSQIVAWDHYYYDDVNNTRITGNYLDEGDQYAYDGAKRLVSVMRGVPTADITNSFATNLVTSPQAYRNLVEYKLDQTGNRLTRMLDGSNDVTYTHNAANEMSTEGANALTYSASGSWTGTSDEYRYTWNDQFGQYIKAGSPAVTFTWHYDALGRRVQFDDSSFPTRTQRYYYDGDQMVENSQWSGSAEAARKASVFGDRIDDLVMYADIGNNLSYYAHKDHLGSVQVLVNGSGAIQESYRYNEYGATTIVDVNFAKLTTTLTSPVGNPHRYTGREQHNSVGGYGNDWYYYRAREYRPDVGNFLQRDAAGYVDSANQYSYVNNSPVSSVDPFGLHAGPPPSQLPPGTFGNFATVAPGVTGVGERAKAIFKGSGGGTYKPPFDGSSGGGFGGVIPPGAAAFITCPNPCYQGCDVKNQLPASPPFIPVLLVVMNLDPSIYNWSCTATLKECHTVNCPATTFCKGGTRQSCNWFVHCQSNSPPAGFFDFDWTCSPNCPLKPVQGGPCLDPH